MYSKFSNLYDEWSKCYDLDDIEMQIINQYVDFKNCSILEVGCGTGRFTRKLLKYTDTIYAIDNDPITLLYAKEQFADKSVSFHILDACEMSNYYNAKFDYVIYTWSLNYIENVCISLDMARKLLKPNGKILILYTYTGDYENLIMSIREESKIEAGNYEIALEYFQHIGMPCIEDEINSSFVFNNIEDALRLNSFFFEVDGAPLTSCELEQLKYQFLLHQKNDKKIKIKDKVKLLIGGYYV